MSVSADHEFMAEALKEAVLASQAGEVPIGTVIVRDGKILARGRNMVEQKHSVAAHAEFEAMQALAEQIIDWRMTGYTLYVTKEPCLMCTGMLINARFSRIVYGLKDPAGGGCGGAVDLTKMPGLLWHPEITGGICADETLDLIRKFFKQRRESAKNN